MCTKIIYIIYIFVDLLVCMCVYCSKQVRSLPSESLSLQFDILDTQYLDDS